VIITRKHKADNSVSGARRSRERLLSLRIRASSLFSTSVFAIAALLAALSLFGNSENGGWLSAASMGLRNPASRPFPNVASTSDYDDQLDDYQPYLQFVLAVGNDVDSRRAKALAAKWTELKKRDKRAAARFLKGLKFEMDQRLQLTGGATRRMHSDSPAVRRWVKKYLPDWYREADEHLYRSYALRLAARTRTAE
jgi:hypothetical protein